MILAKSKMKRYRNKEELIKKVKKKISIFIIILLIISILLLIISNGEILNMIQNTTNNKTLVSDNFVLRDNEDDSVNITITRENGIDKVTYPSGFEIICKNKNTVSIDYKVEENNEYEFIVTDSKRK